MTDIKDMVSVPREWAQHYADLLEERCGYEKAEQVTAFLAQPAQHQGEPVAWLWEHVNGLRICTTSERPPFTNEHAIPPNCKKTPLYTHADPGEVERLRAEFEDLNSDYLKACADFDEVLAQRDTLRAQLAERDALLADIKTKLNGQCWAWPGLIRRIDELSASAEPSAPDCATCNDEGAVGNILDTVPCPDCAAAPPVERDERAAFEREFPGFKAMVIDAKASQKAGRRIEQQSNMFKAWLARAALETKP